MKTLYILKVGTTFPETLTQLGDFDRWIAASQVLRNFAGLVAAQT